MEKIRNKIITISGEPASGKSTVVKVIKDKYEQMGYQVQIISVGNVFRQLIQEEYYKTYPDRKNVSLADIQTDEEFKPKRNKIDKMVDEEVARRGQLINQTEHPNNVYIIDSRLAWSNIPDSYAIRLTINEAIAGQRAFNDPNRGPEDRYDTVEEAIEKTKLRKLSEVQRYKERYGVDLTNPDNYDLIVDTSFSNQEELADIIIKGEENYRTGKWYPKTWKSPAMFLPSQIYVSTIAPSCAGTTLEGLTQKIKKEGFDYSNGEVDTLEYNGDTYIKDGHHRALSALAAGKTLIPYYIEHKDDDYSKSFVKGILTISDYYDWEDGIRGSAKIGGIKSLQDFDITKVFDMEKILGIKLKKQQPEER